MPRTILPVLLCLVLLAGLPAHAQTRPTASGLELSVRPDLLIPLGEDGDYYRLGFGAAARVGYRMPEVRWLGVAVEAGYHLLPIDVIPSVSETSLSLLGVGAQLSVGLDLFQARARVEALLAGGYSFDSLSGPAESGNTPYLGGGLAFRYWPLPSLGLGVEATYRNYLELYQGLAVSLSTTYALRSRKGEPGGPRPLQLLQLGGVELQPVFPVLYKYYDDHPVGAVLVRNTGKLPLRDVRLSLYVEKYMDNPKYGETLASLGPGEERRLEAFGLFNEKVLEITAATKLSAVIAVECRYKEEAYRNQSVATLRVLDRNASSWDDDRKAAAFVTATDPTVLRFAKNTISALKDRASRALNQNLLAAIGLHEALALYGLSYVVDPASSYIVLSQRKDATDYLQFPSQTLDYRSGDCDDLSILYSALLEAVAVESAFVTVPGHIFAAVSLGLSPEEARKSFAYPEELILTGEKAWLPVEVTSIGDGFLKAWELGAKQWREYAAKGQARLLPIREAWATYEAVGFAAEGQPASPPESGALVAAYLSQVDRLVNRELGPRVSGLERQLASSQSDPKLLNRLGVLFARYGKTDLALAQFTKALRKGPYLPALVNAGNLQYLEGRPAEALTYYEKAYALAQDNAHVILALARANHELERWERTRAWYGMLKAMDAKLATAYSYLELQGESAARAAQVGALKEKVIWEAD